MKRTVFALLLCLVMIVSMVVPASAAMARANNVTETIYHNGKAYTASYSVSFSLSSGGWGVARSGGAYISVTLPGVSVRFETLHDGYITCTGLTTYGTFDENITSIKSKYTAYPEPDQVVGYGYVSGSAIFHGDRDYTVSAYMY